MPGPMSVPNGSKEINRLPWDARIKDQGRLRTGKTDLKRGKIERRSNVDGVRRIENGMKKFRENQNKG